MVAATLTGDFGVLTIDAAGNWSYDFDDAEAFIVVTLMAQIESFLLRSFDGSVQELVIFTCRTFGRSLEVNYRG